MKHLPPIVFALLCAGTSMAAPPLDQPPAKDTASRGEAKAADPGAAVAPVTEPDASQLLPPKVETHAEARIEERRFRGRVVEIIVTPAGRSYSYTIQNRDDRLPLSVRDLASGLSTPSFLKFEF